MTGVLSDALLLVSLLFVRPVPGTAWARRLMLHASLLALCLASVLPWAPSIGLCLTGLMAALLQAALALLAERRIGRLPLDSIAPGRRQGRPGVVWLPIGLLLVALAVILLPDGQLPATIRGIPAVALAILLTGLLGALAGPDAVARCGALLLAGDGLILVACRLPGLNAAALAAVLLLQAGLGWIMVREQVA